MTCRSSSSGCAPALREDERAVGAGASGLEELRVRELVCHQACFARRALVEPGDLRCRLRSDVDWCIRMRNQIASSIERFQVMVEHCRLLGTAAQRVWFALRLILKP